MGRPMGLDFGLESPSVCYKRKYRWLFKIPDVSAEGVNALPPSKGARPNLSFKEMEAQHLTETIYYPGKPEWKPVNLTLYEVGRKGVDHPVLKWIKELYNPENGTWKPSCDGFKRFQCFLEMYDGCGELLERWVFENIWVQAIEFGDLDMSSSEVVVCDMTLRYDRAYVTPPNAGVGGGGGGNPNGGGGGNPGLMPNPGGGGNGISPYTGGGGGIPVVTGGGGGVGIPVVTGGGGGILVTGGGGGTTTGNNNGGSFIVVTTTGPNGQQTTTTLPGNTNLSAGIPLPPGNGGTPMTGGPFPLPSGVVT